jgi:hypothetical protein
MMRRRAHSIQEASVRQLNLIPILLVLAAGCASSRSGSEFGAPDRLTEAEIRGSDVPNAWEVVQKLRPRWLREGVERSLRLDTVILVYQDGVRLGEVDVLKTIPVEAVRGMRVLGAAEAGTLPGLGSRHVERVIMISTTGGR